MESMNRHDFCDALRRINSDLGELYDRAEESMATIEMNQEGYFLEYTISGELNDVLKAVATIFSEYNSLGYGTRVKSLDMQMNGTYTAQMSRSPSAD
jgi:hypothetical protein